MSLGMNLFGTNNDRTEQNTGAPEMSQSQRASREKSPDMSTDTNDDEEGSQEAEMERRTSRVQSLARTFTGTHTDKNPFQADKDSPLNPHGPNFSSVAWAKAMVNVQSKTEGPSRTSGVCFQNLNVHGFGEATDYQKDLLNIWLSIAGSIKKLVTPSSKRKINILHNYDGIVRNGEMLVVLGPPGSGCSTFLKTIAGETNGLYVDSESYFNYKGMSGLFSS